MSASTSSEPELPAREAMEFDVVVVGAGPAGLAAAIRLKQLAPEATVVVVEKGSEVGAHILSGAVIDPIGLDRLLPDWRGEDSPLKTQVSEDRFYWLSSSRALRVPNLLMPPLMSNHGNYVVSLGNVCRWLAAKAEGLGVEIYPGFAAVEVLFDANGAVAGVATGDMGIAKDGHHKDSFTRGMELRAKYTLFAEGARGSLTKTLLERFGLDAEREPQKFGIGLKELWEVAPERHRPGLVQHSFGWPLDNHTGGGSFLYHFDDRLVSVGFVVHLNYRNPYLSPFEEFQRFKTHPLVSDTFAGGKRLSYGARAITEGGYQSVPKLAFPGGALIGCAAGFLNVPRIKGSHNAMLSGILAAEHVANAVRAGRANDELASYEQAWRDLRDRPRSLARCATSSRCGRASARWGHCAGRPRHVVEHIGFLGAGNPTPRQARLAEPAAGRAIQADCLSQARRQGDLRPAVLGLPVQYQSRGRPAGAPPGRRSGPAGRFRARYLWRTIGAVLSGRGLRMGGGGRPPALRDQCPELRPLQDLRHQGPESKHYMGAAGGWRRPQLPKYVIGQVTMLPYQTFQ